MDQDTGAKRRVAQWGTLHQTNKAEHQSLALGGNLLHFWSRSFKPETCIFMFSVDLRSVGGIN